MNDLTSEQVWEELEKQLFAVVGMVSARNEARTVGIVYKVHKRRLYFATKREEWKTRHIAQNPHVSMTVTVAKRIPLLSWIKIPPATITFPGEARVLDPAEAPSEVVAFLYRGLKDVGEISATAAVIEVTPQRAFVTYGIGVSLLQMRDTEFARGRVGMTGEQELQVA